MSEAGEKGQMASALPAGTVSFLFTDIEGSTRLAEQLGPRYDALLEDHRALIRDAVHAEDGHEVNTGGDSFFLAFSSASRAVRAALAAQRALLTRSWPEGAEVRVRMGIHTGEATSVGDDYVGVEVHRAARIAAAAHGGQIVLSNATWTIVREALAEVDFRDLGQHRLKDLARPERVFQVVAPGLPTDFPPLRTVDAIPNNLPTQLTSFIGRESVVAEARRLLEGTRALTLTGPGGTGKTRLALQLAAEVLPEFDAGAYFVALAPISDPALVAPEIAQTLGLQQTSNVSPVDAVVDYLRDKRLLLVLDNFEQLIPAAPVVSLLLKGSPGLKVVVTSRSALHISGEQELEVPTLGLPPQVGRPPPTLDALTHYEAVALFIERAVAVKPDFRVTNENAAAVAAICARLDGLPLAIELAAARIKLLPPRTMLARLERGLGVLESAASDVPDRQRTLRNTIAWSHDLLDPAARRLFARFGIFVGGAHLDEAEAVCGPADELGVEVLDGLASLVDHSLVRQHEAHGEPRFMMLETIREFARERLEESGESELLRRRHAEAFVALAERAEPELTGVEQRAWLDRLEHEHDNLRAAIKWAFEGREVEIALRLTAALWRFWQMRGFLNEGREQLARVLALPDVEAHPRLLAKAEEAAGGVAYWQGDLKRSHGHYARSLTILRQLGDELGVANALYNIVFPNLIGLQEQIDTPEGRANADEALATLAESLEIYRRHGDERGIATVLWGIGSVQYLLDLDAARETFLEGLQLQRKLGDRFGAGWSLRELGIIEQRSGDLAQAGTYFGEALETFHASGDVSGITLLLNDLSRVAFGQRQLGRGATLAGAAAALQATSGADLAAQINEVMGTGAGEEIDIASLSADWQAGQRMSTDEVVAFALEEAEPASPVPLSPNPA